jgi:hypothetical protein
LILVKLTKLEKQYSISEVIELGREICVNDEHFLKQFLLIEVIELGKEICVNNMH